MENNDIRQGDPVIAEALRFIGWASIVIGIVLALVSLSDAVIGAGQDSSVKVAIGIASAVSGIPFLGFGYAISSLRRIEMILLGAGPGGAAAAPSPSADPRTDALADLLYPPDR